MRLVHQLHRSWESVERPPHICSQLHCRIGKLVLPLSADKAGITGLPPYARVQCPLLSSALPVASSELLGACAQEYAYRAAQPAAAARVGAVAQAVRPHMDVAASGDSGGLCARLCARAAEYARDAEHRAARIRGVRRRTCPET